MLKELVIAAYDKPLDWISKLNGEIKITIYRKGNSEPIRDNEILIEPNLGRCVHTFFYHIYNNYDKLANYTFFVQDFPFDHWGNVIKVINNNTWENDYTLKIDGYYGFHNNTLGSAWNLTACSQFTNGSSLRCSSNGYPQDNNPLIDVNKYWNLLFDESLPNEYEFIPGGHFGITKEQIHIRSKEFYKKCCELLIEDITAPWMFERLESYIFDKKFKSKF